MRTLLLAAAALGVALAQPSIESTVNELFRLKTLNEAVVSPDGKQVAWVQTDGTPAGLQILKRPVSEGGMAERVSAGSTAKKEDQLAWSPDSSQLAFLSDAGSKGQQQLWVAAKGKARRLTNWKGACARPRWSPDGKQIAVLFSKDAPRFGGAIEAIEPEVGVIDSQVYDQKLALVDVASGTLREITERGMSVHEFDWSPDSKRILYTAAASPADAKWWVARLYTIEVGSGKAQEIYKPELQITIPRWSPDGKQVSFISGLMSDEGVTGGDLFVMSADGGTARNLTAGRKTTPSWAQWLPSSKRLIVSEYVKGSVAVSTVDVETGTFETSWRGDESLFASGDGHALTDLSVASDGNTSALIRSSFSQAPEVWAGPVGKWAKMSKLNEGLKPQWGEAKNVDWTSEGFNVQGWLLLPVNYDPAKKYPMVVSVHGGPSSVLTQSWRGPFFNLGTLSGQGYFVFFPNPRGSFGQGEDFTKANRKDFGNGDLKDVLAGVDAVLKSYPVDERRIGVGGWSYGGFMTMWTVTQTTRFRAAVAGAGIANWKSYYGQNAIDEWMPPFFGATVYEDPAVYAKSSPIEFVKNVKTPTLVVVGELDGECPPPQSFEFWHALHAFDVKTQLVVYAKEGHQFRDPEHMRDLMRRTLGWFNENLK